jgi:1-acyl-sn-glycerol-3-phosphate acyltransferase
MLLTYIRSALFMAWFILWSVILMGGFVWFLIMPRKFTVNLSKTWSRVLLFGLKWICGLTYEVRGPIPHGGVLVASKHMSMWDTLVLYMLLDDASTVLKRELQRIPFYGWYIWKAGVISINREGKASAMRQMMAEARAILDAKRDIIIFPEGHRMRPFEAPDYKPGVAGLYTQLGVACIPVALNSGQFWVDFVKKPGRILIEFLPAIPPGLKRAEFMTALQDRIESATQNLLAEGQQILVSEGIS